MRFMELVEEYLEQQKYSIKERTYLFYRQVINNHIRDGLGKVDIKLINQHSINNFIFEKYKKGNKKTNKNLSYSTIMIIIGIVNRTLKHGFKRKCFKNKLEVDIKIKKYTDKKVEALSKEEQRKIESYIVNKNKIYSYGILLSLYTGMRIGELLALKWNDIEFKSKLINIKRTVCTITKDGKTTIESTPKTNSSVREIPLTNLTIILLKDLKNIKKIKVNM